MLAARVARLPVEDPDVWWLAAVGRDILASGTAPQQNAYSYTDPDRPWIMHEALMGVVYAQGLETIGPSFFPLFGLLAGAATLTLAVCAMLGGRERIAGGVLALVLALCAARSALFAERPSHVAFVPAMAMLALAFRPRWRASTAALAIALEVVWANLHGSFPLGVVLLLAGAGEDSIDRETRLCRLGTALAAALASLANPYGARLIGLVERYLRGGDETARIIHAHVAEFSPCGKASHRTSTR